MTQHIFWMKNSFGTQNPDGKKRVTLHRGTPVEICFNDIDFLLLKRGTVLNAHRSKPLKLKQHSYPVKKQRPSAVTVLKKTPPFDDAMSTAWPQQKTVLIVKNSLQVPPRKSWRTSQPSQKQQNRRTNDNKAMKDERRNCACEENSDWGRGENVVEDSRSVSQWIHGKCAELIFPKNTWRT